MFLYVFRMCIVSCLCMYCEYELYHTVCFLFFVCRLYVACMFFVCFMCIVCVFLFCQVLHQAEALCATHDQIDGSVKIIVEKCRKIGICSMGCAGSGSFGSSSGSAGSFQNVHQTQNQNLNQSNVMAEQIAQFLYNNSHFFDPYKMGNFLSKSLSRYLNEVEYTQLRLAYVRMFNFVDLTFDVAIRLFLESDRFYLPADPKRASKFVEPFAAVYVEQNQAVFETPESAVTMAFAAILLNTASSYATAQPNFGESSLRRKDILHSELFDNFLQSLRRFENRELQPR